MSRSTSYDELQLIDELAAELGLAPGTRAVERVVHDAGEHRISGLRWGTREPEVVLLHGGSLNAHSWDAMLLLHDVPALALDLPGHGLSAWFDEPLYLPEVVATAVGPAIAALAPNARGVAGHSLGGLAALALAATQPTLVPRLVLVDVSPGSTPDRSQDIIDFVADARFASLEAAVDHAHAYRPTSNRTRLRRSLQHNTREHDDGTRTWRHDAREHPSRDRWAAIFEELPKGWDRAAAVRCPTLLLRGDRSPILTADDVEHYRTLMVDLQVVEIAGAGHNIHGDQPRALGAAIVDFLDLKEQP